jgi:hypothetical protein
VQPQDSNKVAPHSPTYAPFQQSTHDSVAPNDRRSAPLNSKLESGAIKDALLAITHGFGEDDVELYLIGPGFDLANPSSN